MIVPRLRSEARGGASTGASTRYSSVYGNKVSHGQHNNDPDLKRALQYSYTSQAVRKWEKRWVVIHETSMRVHKWMPAPATAPTLASQIVANKTAEIENNGNTDQQPEQQQEQSNDTQQEQDQPIQQEQQDESNPSATQDTQMLVDEESTSQSSQA